MPVDDFDLVAEIEGSMQVVSDNESISHSPDGDNPVDWVYMVGKCQSCSEIGVLEGDFAQTGSGEGSMGAERLYSSKLYSECGGCGKSMETVAEFSEYPQGPIQPYAINEERNVQYVKINGMKSLISPK